MMIISTVLFLIFLFLGYKLLEYSIAYVSKLGIYLGLIVSPPEKRKPRYGKAQRPFFYSSGLSHIFGLVHTLSIYVYLLTYPFFLTAFIYDISFINFAKPLTVGSFILIIVFTLIETLFFYSGYVYNVSEKYDLKREAKSEWQTYLLELIPPILGGLGFMNKFRR